MAFTLTIVRFAIALKKTSDKISNLVPGKILGPFRFLPIFFGLGAFLQVPMLQNFLRPYVMIFHNNLKRLSLASLSSLV
jgi:hypothetical protein